MAILDFLKGQAIDVIEWADNSRNTLVHKYNRDGKDIMMGAQLTVRESQVAIFVNEGQLADVFQPGRYQLSTSNLPVMTRLQAWRFGFNSPFKAEVYFINTRQFMDCKWGTANPVMMRDQDFGAIRLRAFGSFSFRVADPEKLLRECFGTASEYKVEDIQAQVKRLAVSAMSDAIAESQIAALDIASHYDELGSQILERINPKVEPLGIRLVSFTIENISLPDEVEKAMDRRTSMGVVGDLNQYTQFQTAEAIRAGAATPGSAVNTGVGLGAGVAMGQAVAQTVAGAAQPGAFCVKCGAKLMAGAKFCHMCGADQQPTERLCPACGKAVPAGASFCTNCGTKL